MTLLASPTRQELARQVTYLKAQNQILRSKLPKRIELSNQERRQLVKYGKSLGARIKDSISIVSYSTFRKWVRIVEDAPDKRPNTKDAKPGRPRVEESISEAIIRIRKETGWGYTKIFQAMRRLGQNNSRPTAKNVLIDAGLGPQPHDTPDTWSEFLKRHADTMWLCDFACKRKWTIKGMVLVPGSAWNALSSRLCLTSLQAQRNQPTRLPCCVRRSLSSSAFPGGSHGNEWLPSLFCRRIWVSPCTANPSGDWTRQQARNFDMFLQDENLPCTILQRDQDTKYVQAFDDVFTGDGRTVKKSPIKSPNLQAFVECVIQTVKHEVLNGFCIVSEQHLNHIFRIGADWYNKRRGHSGRDNLPPIRDSGDPPVVDLTNHKLVCHTELDGHLKSCRAAA